MVISAYAISVKCQFFVFKTYNAIIDLGHIILTNDAQKMLEY